MNIRQKGFTLIEVLIVIGIIAILAAVVIVAINPGEQFGAANDAKRTSHVNSILNAIDQYRTNNGGKLPPAITTTKTEVCVTGGTCTGLFDLSVLTTDGKYLNSLPIDPACPQTEKPQCNNANGTGYLVQKLGNGRIFVEAPLAELASISLTR